MKKLSSALKILIIKVFGKKGSLSDKTFTKLLFFAGFFKFPNLHNSKTHSRHTCARKINEAMAQNSVYTDKLAVRDYLPETVRTPEVYAKYQSAKEIDFPLLPDSFVLKCNHSSGKYIIVKNKKDADFSQISMQAENWLKENYYFVGREKNYRDISPMLFAEEYLSDIIYKCELFCFNGKTEFFNLIKDEKSTLYGRNLVKIPASYGFAEGNFTLPKNINELILSAEKLASPFDFVRVDFYITPENFIFSELTFNPGGGLVPFFPARYDKIFGSFFQMKNDFRKVYCI